MYAKKLGGVIWVLGEFNVLVGRQVGGDGGRSAALARSAVDHRRHTHVIVARRDGATRRAAANSSGAALHGVSWAV